MFVCLFVGLLFIGHTACVHFAALPPSGRESRSRRCGRPRARRRKHAQREHARACRTTSQRKNRTLMPFKNKTVRARAHAVVYVTAEIFKKREKENQHATSKFSLQFAISWSVYFSNRTESYLIFGRSRPSLVSSSIPIKV